MTIIVIIIILLLLLSLSYYHYHIIIIILSLSYYHYHIIIIILLWSYSFIFIIITIMIIIIMIIISANIKMRYWDVNLISLSLYISFQTDNNDLSFNLERDSRKVLGSTVIYGTILPIPIKLQSENILQEHAGTWVGSSLLSQGLKNTFSEKNNFSVFLNDLLLSSDVERERGWVMNENLSSENITKMQIPSPADLLVKWLESFDSTHPNFKVRHLLFYFLFIY